MTCSGYFHNSRLARPWEPGLTRLPQGLESATPGVVLQPQFSCSVSSPGALSFGSCPHLFWHQAPVSWKTIFPQMGEGSGLGMIQAHYVYCTLHFCYYYIGSTSGHQALGPGGWGCCSIVVVSKPDRSAAAPGCCLHSLGLCSSSRSSDSV